jgi:hypothetical protein
MRDRDSEIMHLRTTSFDLLVIGDGVHGAAIACGPGGPGRPLGWGGPATRCSRRRSAEPLGILSGAALLHR